MQGQSKLVEKLPVIGITGRLLLALNRRLKEPGSRLHIVSIEFTVLL